MPGPLRVSGRFKTCGPLAFEIADNPIVRGERSAVPLCHWHAAVFETLYRTLVDPRLRCAEVACCAMGAPACRFELTRQEVPDHR
jgi:divinyl protochlorophyllide a 8-vinyl-reductase